MAPKNKSKPAAADKSSGGKKEQSGAQSINVRHILCEKHAKKEEALAKLNAGSKFDEVAREFSEDKARQGASNTPLYFWQELTSTISISGGSLGWKGKGSLLPEFEKVAFELEPSTTGKPKWGECKTSEGYHIVMVEGRK